MSPFCLYVWIGLIPARLAQDEDTIDAETVQADTQAAVETLQNLQSQLEEV